MFHCSSYIDLLMCELPSNFLLHEFLTKSIQAGQGSGKIQTAESKAAVEKKPLNASNNKTETLSEQLEPSLTVKTVTEPEESASSIASESSPSSSGSLAGNSVLDERNEKSHGDSMAQGDEGVPEKVPKAQESLKESPKLTEGTTQVWRQDPG